MRTMRKKYLAEYPVAKDVYEVDFSILDRYQGFSSEMLRLSLIGLAIYGFLITNVIFKSGSADTVRKMLDAFNGHTALFIPGAVMLLIAAGCSLAHKYFSTDGMTHHIRRLRVTKRYDALIQLAFSKNADPDIPAADPCSGSGMEHIADHQLTDDQLRCRISRLREVAHQENRSFEKDLRLCKYILILAVAFLVGGIGCVLAGLTRFLMILEL